MRMLLVIVLAVLLTGVVLLTTPITTNNAGFDFDGTFYAAMAGSPRVMPALAHVAPWCRRIVTPFVAALLPWETLASFRVLAFVSDVVSLVILFLILRRLGFDEGTSIFGLTLYAGVFWTLKFSFYSPAYIDPETQLFLLAIVYLTIDARYLALIPVLVVAALQKESLAAFSVFSVVALVRDRGLHLSKTSVLLALTMIAAPLATIAAAAYAVPAVNAYSGVGEIRQQLLLPASARFWPMFVQSMFSGAGLLPMVVALRPTACLRFLASHVEWIAYALLSIGLLFAGQDKARLFLYLLPVMVVLGAIVADDLKASLVTRKTFVWMAVLIVAHVYMGGYLTPMGSFEDYLARMVPEHSPGYLPFLVRNAALAAGFFVFSLVWTRP